MIVERCGLLRDHEPHDWELLVDNHRTVPRGQGWRRCDGTATPRTAEQPDFAAFLRPTAVETARVRVRAFVEAWQLDRHLPGASVVTSVTAPNRLGSRPLYLADLLALLGDDVPEPVPDDRNPGPDSKGRPW